MQKKPIKVSSNLSSSVFSSNTKAPHLAQQIPEMEAPGGEENDKERHRLLLFVGIMSSRLWSIVRISLLE